MNIISELYLYLNHVVYTFAIVNVVCEISQHLQFFPLLLVNYHLSPAGDLFRYSVVVEL